MYRVTVSGKMGVPITFLDKYNSDDWEILGKIDSGGVNAYNVASPVVNGQTHYKRLAIRRKRNDRGTRT